MAGPIMVHEAGHNMTRSQNSSVEEKKGHSTSEVIRLVFKTFFKDFLLMPLLSPFLIIIEITKLIAKGIKHLKNPSPETTAGKAGAVGQNVLISTRAGITGGITPPPRTSPETRSLTPPSSDSDRSTGTEIIRSSSHQELAIKDFGLNPEGDVSQGNRILQIFGKEPVPQNPDSSHISETGPVTVSLNPNTEIEVPYFFFREIEARRQFFFNGSLFNRNPEESNEFFAGRLYIEICKHISPEHLEKALNMSSQAFDDAIYTEAQKEVISSSEEFKKPGFSRFIPEPNINFHFDSTNTLTADFSIRFSRYMEKKTILDRQGNPITYRGKQTIVEDSTEMTTPITVKGVAILNFETEKVSISQKLEDVLKNRANSYGISEDQIEFISSVLGSSKNLLLNILQVFPATFTKTPETEFYSALSGAQKEQTLQKTISWCKNRFGDAMTEETIQVIRFLFNNLEGKDLSEFLFAYLSNKPTSLKIDKKETLEETELGFLTQTQQQINNEYTWVPLKKPIWVLLKKPNGSIAQQLIFDHKRSRPETGEEFKWSSKGQQLNTLEKIVNSIKSMSENPEIQSKAQLLATQKLTTYFIGLFYNNAYTNTGKILLPKGAKTIFKIEPNTSKLTAIIKSGFREVVMGENNTATDESTNGPATVQMHTVCSYDFERGELTYLQTETPLSQ